MTRRLFQELREVTGAQALLGGRRIPDSSHDFSAGFYLLFGGKTAETYGRLLLSFLLAEIDQID